MLQKQSININFSQGLDTKTDAWQVPIGRFISLKNSVFTKGGLLSKRNGYQTLPSLPDLSSTSLTTFNGNLEAIGNAIYALNASSQKWVSKGSIQPLSLSTLPLIRNSINQSQCDLSIAPNGLACVVYSEVNNSVFDYKYAILDPITGQNIVSPTLIPAAGGGMVIGSPRVFVIGTYFIIVFTTVITATPHLQYICITSTNPTVSTTPADIAASYSSASTVSWDGVAANGNLYLAYNTTTGGQAIKITYLTQQAAIAGNPPVTAVTFAGAQDRASMMTLCVDITNPNSQQIYVSFYSAATTNGYTLSIDLALNTIFGPQQIITSQSIANLASAAQNGVCTVYSEVINVYSYDSSIPTNYIQKITVTNAGVVGSQINTIRSVGLASKAFIVNGIEYFLSSYQSPFQPTYFLINGTQSVQAMPIIAAKLAYENSGGYLTLGLPNYSMKGNEVTIPYLFKDLVQALSKAQTSQQTATGGVYSQTGINLVNFVVGKEVFDSAETGANLNFSGGFLWAYDGYLPVEQNFFLWPDSVEVSPTGFSGSMSAQQYFYAVTYEWSDNQGNIHRSAPSVPVTTTLVSNTSVSVDVPTLRLTYKTANPLNIVIYRWSVAQQTYYQVTSITSTQVNSLTTDSITYIDTASDASILGNNILYTTGGVVENINAPSTSILTLFDNRLWIVDAEDPNRYLLSKPVVEGAPVEMSDLFTYFVSPTTASQGSTGPITASAPMDDKLITFKANAIYYTNGTGPDATGANSQYSEPLFITSTVGCANQQSIAFIPDGLVFQSNKGIWLLGRDLSTRYIGDAVEQFNSSLVQSAVNVPETDQVRFTLNTGETLVYDYYYKQWSTFDNVPAISSCIYQGLHTFINSLGAVYQENPGSYLDGSAPVLLSFTTSWINLAGLQGYERLYDFYLLARFLSPHFLSVGVAYDYADAPSQQILINAANYNYTGPWGSDHLWGQTTPWGGPGALEQFRIHTQLQTCESFQITVQEVFNPAFGTVPGEGFTMSGINCRVGLKKGARPIAAAQSF